VVFVASSNQEAIELMQNDPAVSRGIVVAELFPYRVLYGRPRGRQATRIETRTGIHSPGIYFAIYRPKFAAAPTNTSAARNPVPTVPHSSLESFPPTFRVARLPILAGACFHPLPVMSAIPLIFSERGSVRVGPLIFVV